MPAADGVIDRRTKRRLRPLPWVATHVRRVAVEVLNALLNHKVVYRAVGAINRRVRLIESVFLVYPAAERYARAYAYQRSLDRHRWAPGLAGLLVQNRRLTLMVAVSARDEHFWDEASHPHLLEMVARVEALRVMIGARQKTFAGILPGVLAGRGVLLEPPERDITATVVAHAVREVRGGMGGDPPVLVLGAHGFIGRRLVAMLSREMVVHPYDVRGHHPWPDHLLGSPVLLVNVANRHALEECLPRLWSGVVVLNEVYPEPEGHVLAALAARGIPCHHVVGVRARAFPPFPAAYAGAVPCCAAWPAPDAEVVLRALA